MDKTKIAVSVFDKYAKEYQEKFMDVNMYSNSLDLFCKAITTLNANILELACGPGNITSYLLNKRPDFKIVGTDLSPNMLALATINNPSATFSLMDCRAIGTINKKQDAIMCGFCLPYLAEEEVKKLIQDAAKLLKTKGVLYISTMEDEYSKSGFQKGSQGDEIYMHFYTSAFLTDILTKNNFALIHLERKVTTMTNGNTVTDLLIIAENKNENIST